MLQCTVYIIFYIYLLQVLLSAVDYVTDSQIKEKELKKFILTMGNNIGKFFKNSLIILFPTSIQSYKKSYQLGLLSTSTEIKEQRLIKTALILALINWYRPPWAVLLDGSFTFASAIWPALKSVFLFVNYLLLSFMFCVYV